MHCTARYSGRVIAQLATVVCVGAYVFMREKRVRTDA